jgi:thiamine-phosphate pyrophosphorylase
VTLPRLLVLTDRTQCRDGLPATVAAAVESGARAVVLREKDLPLPERAALARELDELLAPVGGVLVWAGLAGSAGAHAVHLSGDDDLPVPRPAVLGRSCHSTADLARARAEGCDHVFLSPVFSTRSKPGYGPALGLAGLADLAHLGPPAYALGGIGPDEVAGCLAAGARGVAVMGAVMRDPGVVRDLVAAVSDRPSASDGSSRH